jgi:hypothetical protein
MQVYESISFAIAIVYSISPEPLTVYRNKSTAGVFIVIRQQKDALVSSRFRMTLASIGFTLIFSEMSRRQGPAEAGHR